MGKEITAEKALDLFEKIIEIKTYNKMLKEMNSDYLKEIERLKGCLSDKEGLIYSMGEEINKLKEVHLPDVIGTVERLLKPQYMTDIYTWNQIETAIKKATGQ